MKKKLVCIFITIIIFFSILVVINYFHSPSYKLNKYANITHHMLKDITYEEKKETSFLGDGIDIISYKIKDNNIEDIINKNKNWLIIDKDFNKTLKELTYQLPKEGYYLIYDLKTKEYTTFTNMYKETKSRDYLLIILDSQNNELVYLEYHS